MLATLQGDRESAVTNNDLPVKRNKPLFIEPASTHSSYLQSRIPSYPTRSLNFLKALPRTGGTARTFSEVSDPKPLLTLNILVVGAGLGGLAVGIALARKGHAVTIFEQASQMGEVRISWISMANIIADSLMGWCRHTSTLKCQQAALTMGPGTFI